MSDAQRDAVELDMVFVGVGPASLFGTCRPARLIERHDSRVRAGDSKLEPAIAVLEFRALREPSSGDQR